MKLFFPPVFVSLPLSFYNLSPVEKERGGIQLDIKDFIVALDFTQK